MMDTAPSHTIAELVEVCQLNELGVLAKQMKVLDEETDGAEKQLQEATELLESLKVRGSHIGPMAKQNENVDQFKKQINEMQEQIVAIKGQDNHKLEEMYKACLICDEVQPFLWRFSTIQEQVQNKQEELKYSSILPADLDKVESYVEERIEHFKFLQTTIEAKVAENQIQTGLDVSSLYKENK